MATPETAAQVAAPATRNALSLPLGGTSTGDRNWGANQDKNQWIAQQTGYGGDFGGGNFSAWASQNGVNVAALEQQWDQRPVVPGPYADPSGGDRNWGANQDKNQWIAQQTGYGGDFGGGNFSAWASQNGVNVAALEQQWSKQQPVVPVPYEDPSGPGIGQQGLMTGQQNIQTGITGLETGQQGLMTGQQNIQTGITGLETGQQGLMTGQQNLQTGQQGILGGQQALGAGQGAIQGAIGAPAEGQPQTLFSGQAGLMGGQQALGQQLTGGIQDITGAVGGVSQNIDALERAAQQYQREAQRQRSQIQTAGLTGREQIARQVADVGQQVNTGVEQQRSLMGGMAALLLLWVLQRVFNRVGLLRLLLSMPKPKSLPHQPKVNKPLWVRWSDDSRSTRPSNSASVFVWPNELSCIKEKSKAWFRSATIIIVIIIALVPMHHEKGLCLMPSLTQTHI
jgi:hypothetical protein